MRLTAREEYAANGYYIFRKLIPNVKIDEVLVTYRTDILTSRDPFFRQSTNRWERTELTPNGYAVNSYRDVHSLPNYPSFSNAVRQVVGADEIRASLSELSGDTEHNVMQTMLFDLNTETPAHQDWYYLDSLPNGHLLAAWIALEDIHENAGRFFVLPQSHAIDFDLTNSLSYTDYETAIARYVEMHYDRIHAPPLQKGDVLFWNSRVIHGSLRTKDPSFSRKSLTAHYLPSEYKFGRRNAERPESVEYTQGAGMKFREPRAIHTRYSLWAKFLTDASQYIHERPALRDIAERIAKIAKC